MTTSARDPSAGIIHDLSAPAMPGPRRRRLAPTLAAAVLALAAAATGAQVAPRDDAKEIIANARRILTPQGVDRLQKVRIGGIEQWVSIRGADRLRRRRASHRDRPAAHPAQVGRGLRRRDGLPARQRRHDFNVNSDVASAWFETVAAPDKHLVWFEHSGHMPMTEEPGKFLLSLVRYARPLAQRAGDAAP